MSRTYKALLTGDRVRWLEQPPGQPGTVEVQITFLEEPDRESSVEQGQLMAAREIM